MRAKVQRDREVERLRQLALANPVTAAAQGVPVPAKTFNLPPVVPYQGKEGRESNDGEAERQAALDKEKRRITYPHHPSHEQYPGIDTIKGRYAHRPKRNRKQTQHVIQASEEDLLAAIGKMKDMEPAPETEGVDRAWN
ncbi:hypothetical protein KIPB_015763, partial [Kipferlia bialata]|eukprot:g15763.t1